MVEDEKLKRLFKFKKGQVQSVLFVLGAIFIISVTVLMSKKIVDEFYTAMDESSMNSPIMQQVQDSMKIQAKNFDYGVVTLLIVFIIGLVITSFMIPTHPIFIIVNVIGVFILVFIGMIFVNVYGEMVSGEQSQLGDQADFYPLINNLIIYLPFIGAIIIFITSIIMYTRGSTG